jgi:hypothetical protein
MNSDIENELIFKVKPKIEIDVTRFDISALLDDQSIDYWGYYNYDDSQYKEALDELIKMGVSKDVICYEDVLANILIKGNTIEIKDVESGDKYKLTLNKLKIGMQKAIEKGYWSGDFDKVDAEINDCIIQCAVLGDVIYG